jgi:hypothetical protein
MIVGKIRGVWEAFICADTTMEWDCGPYAMLSLVSRGNGRKSTRNDAYDSLRPMERVFRMVEPIVISRPTVTSLSWFFPLLRSWKVVMQLV